MKKIKFAGLMLALMLCFGFTGKISFADTIPAPTITVNEDAPDEAAQITEGDTQNVTFHLMIWPDDEEFEGESDIEAWESAGHDSFYVYMKDTAGNIYRFPLEKESNYEAYFSIPPGYYSILSDVYDGYNILSSEFSVEGTERGMHVFFFLTDEQKTQCLIAANEIHSREVQGITEENQQEQTIQTTPAPVEGNNETKIIEQEKEESSIFDSLKRLGINDIIIIVGVILFLLGMVISKIKGINIFDKLRRR